MATITVSHERTVAAPPEAVYTCIADYKNHHVHFLPAAFKHYQVEQGGYGAGTVFSFATTGFGQLRAFRMTVEEPGPGRVLIERDTLSPLVTTWQVAALGERCRVSVLTVFPSAKGFAGVLERLVLPLSMRAIYADELRRLERYAKSQLGGILKVHGSRS